MVVLYFASVLLAFIYIFIITHILTAWKEIEEWTVSPDFKPDTRITVLIPFRNEEGFLGQCLDSVLRSNYPKNLLEVIAVDDHSEDGSSKEVPSSVRILTSESQGKKSAIITGVKNAQGKIIVTTDADCIVGRDWLMQIASYYEFTKKRMIVGMVALNGKKSVLEYFQIMDTCGVMGLHAAGIHNGTHFLANGANLAFEKSLFEEMNPFSENMDVASGDDVFFVNKVGQDSKESIGFLKSTSAIVETVAENSWSSLWQQRKRWATKNSRFSKGIYRWMTGSIWLFCLSIFINIALIPFTAGLSLFVALTQLLIKGIMDFLYLQNMCEYFGKQKVLKLFIPALFIQTTYVVIAGFYALMGGKYSWKNRKVS